MRRRKPGRDNIFFLGASLGIITVIFIGLGAFGSLSVNGGRELEWESVGDDEIGDLGAHLLEELENDVKNSFLREESEVSTTSTSKNSLSETSSSDVLNAKESGAQPVEGENNGASGEIVQPRVHELIRDESSVEKQTGDESDLFSDVDTREFWTSQSATRAVEDSRFPPGKERYLLFDPMYGQLNNQLCSLVNALVVGRATNATVVIPAGEIGGDSFEGVFRTRIMNDAKVKQEFYLVGDYFDFDLLASQQKIMTMKDFLSQEDLVQNAKKLNLVVTPTNLRRINEFTPYDILGAAQMSREKEENRLSLATSKDSCNKLLNVYTNALEDSSHNEQFICLGCTFLEGHIMDCMERFPYWLNIRRFIQPLQEYRDTIDEYRNSLDGKVIAVHLRVLAKGESGGKKPNISELIHQLVPAQVLDEAKFLYVAYGTSEMKEFDMEEVLEQLQKDFWNLKIQTCSKNMPNCPTVENGELVARNLSKSASFLRGVDSMKFQRLFQSNYAAALLDLWMCVESDFFVGRETSTFSKNVSFWRSAFATSDRILPFNFYHSLV